MYCKVRGHRDGACAWDTESGANDCHCDTELRGIRLVLIIIGLLLILTNVCTKILCLC